MTLLGREALSRCVLTFDPWNSGGDPARRRRVLNDSQSSESAG